ncbi:MAG: hypothetical protein PHW00_06275 [Clostridia bacterium]|nr:hypothetical protein [Clostridia bacterium]
MKLYDRVDKDEKEIEQEYRKKGIEYVFQHAYDLSFYYQVVWYFEDIEENLKDDDLAYFDILHTYEGNIPRDIFHQFESYSSPEYYNFNTYEGIDDIIRYFVDDLKKKQGEIK